MAVVAWDKGVPKLGNLLAAYPVTQLLTWLLQIMPLFFFAGGAANALSWDKHQQNNLNYQSWLWARTSRLLRPLWVYLVIAGSIATIITFTAPIEVASPLLLLTTQLLWFLGAYFLTTALTPLFKKSTPKNSALTLITLIFFVALVDLLTIIWHLPQSLGLINFVLVWAIPSYLGALRSHGTLLKYQTKTLLMLILANLTANALLINFGPWPLSLVGMPGEKISNMAPPTLPLAIHAITIIFILTLIDKPLARILQNMKIWTFVTGVNLKAMTLYLWHLPILVTLFAASHALNLDRPTSTSLNGFPVPANFGYALGSLLFLPIFALLVYLVVTLLAPFEYLKLPWWDTSLKSQPPKEKLGKLLSIIAVLGIGISMLMLSATGLGGFPFKITHYAGLPLNPALAILLLLLSASIIRYTGGKRQLSKDTTTPPQSSPQK